MYRRIGSGREVTFGENDPERARLERMKSNNPVFVHRAPDAIVFYSGDTTTPAGRGSLAPSIRSVRDERAQEAGPRISCVEPVALHSVINKIDVESMPLLPLARQINEATF